MALRPPSLRAVAAFEAAARHRSFTRAAGELNLSQSAVSHAIRTLEERVGERLFERRGRNVALTETGRALASRARLGIALIGDAFNQGVDARRRRLVVTMLPSVAEAILLPRLARFRERFPDIYLDIRTGSGLLDVEQGEADVAIRFGPGGWAGLASVHIADEWLFPVASPAYRGGRLPQSPGELRECALIGHPESIWALWFDSLDFDSSGIEPELMLDDALLVLRAAREGLGIALARAWIAQAELEAGRLVRLFEHRVPAEYSYWCVWAPGTGKRLLIDEVVEWLVSAFRHSVGRPVG